MNVQNDANLDRWGRLLFYVVRGAPCCQNAMGLQKIFEHERSGGPWSRIRSHDGMTLFLHNGKRMGVKILTLPNLNVTLRNHRRLNGRKGEYNYLG